MARYLFIESRDPFTSADTGAWAFQASKLATAGNRVTWLYVNDGVLATRYKSKTNLPFMLIANGVTLFADDWSMAERGIPKNFLIEGVQPVSMQLVIDEMVEGSKVLWH